jgi:hypothetical protein
MPKKPSLKEKVSRGVTHYLGSARGHPVTQATFRAMSFETSRKATLWKKNK